MTQAAASAEARPCAVAGRFYPLDPSELADEVTKYLGTEPNPRPARAVIGPHAGYMYSGAILGETYAAVEIPPTVVIMCPNHTGRGHALSLWSGGPWLTPAGPLEIDQRLAAAIEERTDAVFDREAHRYEHAIEVHLPFLLARRRDVRIVPITLARLSLPQCRRLGEGLAAAIAAHDTEVLLAASTDMSHYLDARTARRLDEMALARVLDLDPDGLHQTVESEQISMCGYVPTTVALVAARTLGADTAELVRYGNSGEASGDFDHVVGYAGVAVR